MNNEHEIMRSLNEVTLLPSAFPSTINHRSEIDPYVHDENIKFWAYSPEQKIKPVFCSPMTTLINFNNWNKYLDEGITPILPRIGTIEQRISYSENCWVSFSLSEFEEITNNYNLQDDYRMILIDMADGHISRIYDLVRLYKSKYKYTLIMVGNIDHPNMYIECCKAGVDYVRVGIGGGRVCSTTMQTGIHASHVYMSQKINQLRSNIYTDLNGKHWFNGTELPVITKTIADGGINTTDKMIKCIALGFDYVMAGEMFAHTEITCGLHRCCVETYNHDKLYINTSKIPEMSGDVKNIYLENQYYGMASEQGQKAISGGAKKNPEGFEIWVKQDSTIKKTAQLIDDAFRSSMSYLYASTLEEMKECEWQYQSISEYNAYYNKQ